VRIRLLGGKAIRVRAELEVVALDGVAHKGVDLGELVPLLEEDDAQPLSRPARRLAVRRERRAHQVQDGDGVLAAVEAGDDTRRAVQAQRVRAHLEALLQRPAELVLNLRAELEPPVQREGVGRVGRVGLRRLGKRGLVAHPGQCGSAAAQRQRCEGDAEGVQQAQEHPQPKGPGKSGGFQNKKNAALDWRAGTPRFCIWFGILSLHIGLEACAQT